MQDLEPRDRQDEAIWTAIGSGNLKGALKLVNRKLAKDSKDQYNQAIKVYINSCSPQVSERNAAAAELLALPDGSPISDKGALQVYSGTFDTIFPSQPKLWADIIGKTMLIAYQKNPKMSGLGVECFQACVEMGDFEHAIAIMTRHHKQFGGRASLFWKITAMVLYASTPGYPEKMQDIYSRLSYGEMKKLGAATGSDKDKPANSLQSSQELQLLYRLADRQKEKDDAFMFYSSPDIGPACSIAKGEWVFIRNKVLFLRKVEKWQELFDYCKKLLSGARANSDEGQLDARGADWTVWIHFIESALVLGQEQKDLVSKEIIAHLEADAKIDKTYNRNAALASLKFTFDSPQLGDSASNSAQQISALVQYVAKFRLNPSCFGDILPYASQLTADDQSSLLEILQGLGQQDGISSQERLMSNMALLKLRYLFMSKSRLSNSEPPMKDSLEKLASQALKLYKQFLSDPEIASQERLMTDQHPADDFVLVAAMCLLKLGHNENEKRDRAVFAFEPYLQAASILEYALTHSKYNYEISLLLVRTYALLGCGSLALLAYQRLGVKGIQTDTLSYVILDRISSLHPHAATVINDGKEEVIEPTKFIQEGLTVYRRSRKTIMNNVWLSFQIGSYDTVLDLWETAEHLESSISKSLNVVEMRRVTRLAKPKEGLNEGSHGMDLLNSKSILSSKLDSSVFPSYEHPAAPPFETYIRLGLPPSSGRMAVSLLLDHLHTLAATPKSTPELLQGRIRTLADLSLRFLSDDYRNDKLGNEEQNLFDLGIALTEAVLLLTQGGTLDKDRKIPEEANEALRVIGQRVVEFMAKISSPLTALPDDKKPAEQTAKLVPDFLTVLFPLYTAHEACALTHEVGSFLKEGMRNGWAEEALMGQGQKLKEDLVEKTRYLKRYMDEGGWLDKIEDAVRGGEDEGGAKEVGTAVEEVVGEGFLEQWAGEVRDSWVDSVDGLVRVCAK